MIVKGKLTSGGGSGSGLFKLKKPIFKAGDSIMVKFVEPKFNCDFYSNVNIVDGKQSIYVPRKIVSDNVCIQKNVELQLEKVEGFFPKVGTGGRIYIPLDYAKKLKLKTDEIIVLNTMQSGESKNTYTRVRVRKKNSKVEYYCFTSIRPNESVLMTISKTPALGMSKNSILNGFNHVFLNRENALVFDGHSKPIIFNSKIILRDMSRYLGAYFADGTKKGNSWAICASTPQQANYYYSMHRLIFPESMPCYNISFTDIEKREPKRLSELLLKKWRSNVKFDLSNCKCRIISSSSVLPKKLNELGTLVLKENRGVMLKVYAKLLTKILEESNPSMALDFILGVLEGDGTVNAKKRGHIQIITNEDDYKKIATMLKKAKINYSFIYEKPKNKYYFRIGSLELLRHFFDIREKIFQYYPKRRKSFVARFFSTGAVKYLIGGQSYASSWVKTELKKFGFLNKNYLLTAKGSNLKKALVEMMGEFISNAQVK